MSNPKFNQQQDKEIAVLYINGKTAQQIAKLFGVYKQPVLNSLKRTQTPRRKWWPRAAKEKHGNWHGGTRMIKGYKHIYLPGHRLARTDGWIAEHRLLKELEIIEKSQIVHHKDGIRTNNSLENLLVFSNNSEHIKYHNQKWLRDKFGKFSKENYAE